MTASTISSLTLLRSILGEEDESAASFISTEDALDLGGDGGSLFAADWWRLAAGVSSPACERFIFLEAWV